MVMSRGIKYLSCTTNYTSSPWKTQAQVRKIVETAYNDGPDGLIGNDDVGQMSAWYVFSSIGFYPVSPVSGEYLLCSPIFDTISIKLNKGKKFMINVQKKSPKSQFIHNVSLNGIVLDRNYIKYDDLKNGGELIFYLQDQPDLKWAASANSQPAGLSKTN